MGGPSMQIQKETPHTLSWTDVEKLCQPEAAGEERREIVRRLVSRAARQPRRETPGAGLPDAARPEDYEDALRRAVERTRQSQERLTQEKRDADRLWTLLEGHTPARRAILIRNDRRVHTPGGFGSLRGGAPGPLGPGPPGGAAAAGRPPAGAPGPPPP